MSEEVKFLIVDGLACVKCGHEWVPGDRSRPTVNRSETGSQLFECVPECKR